MRRITTTLIALFTVAVSLLIGACDSNDNSLSQNDPRIRILLTDAPAKEIATAFVTISRIEIVGADSVTQTLSETAQEFDLLTLQNDSVAVLVDTALNEGVFNYLRLYVEEDANVMYDDNTQAGLTIPSGFHSGVKVLLHNIELVDETDTLTIVLDFDAAQSFVPAGESDLLIFKPVVMVKRAEKNGNALALE